MKFKKMLAVASLSLMPLLFSFMSSANIASNPLTITAQANTAADQQAINDLMPNQKLQQLVLLNMKYQGIVNQNVQMTDFTLATFKDDLAQLTSLDWPIGTQEETNALDPVDGGNGVIGPANPGNYSLKGVEDATNLTKFSISVNYGYGHQFMRNDITDISPLKNLTKLEYLNLVGNRVADISPIAKLPNLKTLYINDNCIYNLNVLNAKQYTGGFNYLNQVVVLPAVDLSSNSYTWEAPFKDALPQNTETTTIKPFQPYDPKWIGTGTKASGFQAETTSPYQHIQVFRSGVFNRDGTEGSAKVVGDDIDYQGLAPQIQPSADDTDPWGTTAAVIHNPYTYYMIAQYRYFPGGGTYSYPVMTYFKPYTITPLVAKPVTVDYVDEQGNTIHAAQTITGSIDQAFDLSTSQYQLSIPGYTFKAYEPAQTGKISDQSQTFKLVYTKNPSPVNPVNPDTPTEPIAPSQPVIPTTPTKPEESTTSEPASVEQTVVYSLKKVYLYKTVNFKKSERIVGYAKKPRVFRPMFVVTGYRYSKAGNLRYQVRDVNHESKRAGKTGFITANAKYVRPVYYQSKQSVITVISPTGVKEYRNRNLTSTVRHYPQGQVVKVGDLVTHNLTRRYLVLADGNYITSNRKLVQLGRVKMPKRITVKQPINRYRDANFTKRNGSYKQGTKLTVKGYTYSHATSLTKSGTKRLVVSGGYVTANKQFVKIYYK